MSRKKEQQYTFVIEQDEDGYFVASVPALPGCHTQAKTIGELKKRVREAIHLCIQVSEEDAEYRKSIRDFAYTPTFIGLETITI